MTHTVSAGEVVVITDQECAGKAVRLRNSTCVTYEFLPNVKLLKIFVEFCSDITIKLASDVTTSFVEVFRCSGVHFEIESTIQMIQLDDCTENPVHINFLEPECIGSLYHQNCPSLLVAPPGGMFVQLGRAGQTQLVSAPDKYGGFLTETIRRGEKRYPIQLGSAPLGTTSEPDPESLTVDDARRFEAEQKREKGNDAFKAKDFRLAAAFYTEALEMCNDLHLACVNLSQCWLRLGEPNKALANAVRCTELASGYFKGWFRKGAALHALGRYQDAIEAFSEAKRLDYGNHQIEDAIKMAQVMKCCPDSD